MVKHVTLLQARCSAVFLCESCSARSAFALLTITSATCEMVKHQEVEKSNNQQSVCVPACALTHGVGLPIESGHHQRRPAQVCVDHVGLGSVAQEEGDALHVVRESCGMKGGPGRRHTHTVSNRGARTLNKRDVGEVSHLPLESVELTMTVPRDSINISATPSLSFILKHTKSQSEQRLSTKTTPSAQTRRLSYTAQCSGLNELPVIFLNTSWSNNTSTQASYPEREERRGFKHSAVLSAGVCQVCFHTVVAGPVQRRVALVVCEVCDSV